MTTTTRSGSKGRLFHRLGGLAVVAALTVAPAAAQDRVLDINILRKEVREIVDGWEESSGVNVDPRTAEWIAGEIGHFFEIWGYDYGVSPRRENPQVRRLISDRAALEDVLEDYLDSAAEDDRIDTVMHRLAVEVGSRADAAGWPSSGPNPYTLADFSDDLPAGSYTLESGGRIDHRAATARRFLVLPGDHGIIPQSSPAEKWEFVIEGEFPGAGGAAASGGRRR